jgi:hypothetical protein
MGVPVLLLKGAALAEVYYPRPEWRVMGDVDLLVPSADADSVWERLLGLGYRIDTPGLDGSAYSDSHHFAPLRSPTGGICIEVHRAVAPPGASERRQALLGGDPFDASCGAQLEGYPFRLLSPAFQILHVSCHWQREFTPARSLVGLCDSAAVLRRFSGEDWGLVLGFMEDPYLRAPLAAMLKCLCRVAAVDLPLAVRASLGARSASTRLAESLEQYLLDVYALGQRPPGALATQYNICRAWQAVTKPGSGLARLGAAAWKVAVPDVSRSRLVFAQTRRARNALGRLVGWS